VPAALVEMSAPEQAAMCVAELNGKWANAEGVCSSSVVVLMDGCVEM
jgi:hypothetical protein